MTRNNMFLFHKQRNVYKYFINIRGYANCFYTMEYK